MAVSVYNCSSLEENLLQSFFVWIASATKLKLPYPSVQKWYAGDVLYYV